ncbi:MAG: hypothetical protein WAR76_23070 [Xanthobacteraceae bacterium]
MALAPNTFHILAIIIILPARIPDGNHPSKEPKSRYWAPATQTAINGVSGGPHEALLSFENNAAVL